MRAQVIELEMAPLEDPKLELLDRLTQLIWITNVDTWQYRWANRAALDFWQAESLAELTSRRLAVSDTIRTTFFHVRERAAQGEVVWLDHTVYPRGIPTRIQSHCSAYPLPEGGIGLMTEAGRLTGQTNPDAANPDVIRAYEAVRYAPLVVTTHGLDGATLTANALARRTFGHRFNLYDMFQNPAEAEEVLTLLRDGELVSRDALVRTLRGPSWFAIEARRIPDPVTGDDAIVISASDVTARRRAEIAKDELISVVSHELRTPLTAVSGALTLLRHAHLMGDTVQEEELFDIASENASRLGRLLDDLLDVQRIGAASMDLHRAPLSLRPLAVRAVNLLAPLAKAREVTLSVFGGDALLVEADEARMLQVLSNLLSNAIKHSPRGGLVSVEIAQRAGMVRVSISDQGPGVPEAFRDRIFGRFEQADASDSRSMGGAGLGLYIARTLVEHHGGRLDLEETGGPGATFYFELPAAERAPVA